MLGFVNVIVCPFDTTLNYEDDEKHNCVLICYDFAILIITNKRFTNTHLNQEGWRHPHQRPAEQDPRRTMAGGKKEQHLNLPQIQ